MKVSAKAEYACVAMVDLATKHRSGQPVQIKNIAEAHGISPRFLVQILLQLKGAGLVASSRGVSGGYQLTRAPEEISVLEIVNTIDRSFVECAEGRSNQSLILQSLRAVWQEITATERRILQNTTLAELVQRSQGQGVTSYQI